LQDIIAILGVEELADEDKIIVARAKRLQKFLTQPMFTAEQFTGLAGRYVPLSQTILDFSKILNGDCDHLPEQAFYMVGSLEDVYAKADKLRAS